MFDMRPSVTKINFYRQGRGYEEDVTVREIKLENDEENFELGFEMTLAGLDFLKTPKELIGDDDSQYNPFYLYFILYLQRGQRDNKVISFNSRYVTEDELKMGNLDISFTVTKFLNRKEDDGLDYNMDFITSMLHFSVFYSYEENVEDISQYINNPYLTLFSTKIPYIVEGILNE
ncbi:hypothetical protein [Listeria costaricensis]|uniref:hypothetical protein n=1 Tax=Listeria costaricensis TaxID=2026604 RepID=UPI000C079D76|nr:hypothetical protein [Listeria costaricensis]